MGAPGGCANICLCTEGFGCYQFGSDPPETKNNCDCSPEACEGGEDVCDAKVSSHSWTDQCKSYQCPSDEYDPPCKPIKEPAPAPEPTPGRGCYVSQSVRDAGYEFGACDCTMTEAECDAEPKEGAFPIWTDGCEDICLCEAGFGCYQLDPEPAGTQHTCDCSAEACAGGADACSAQGELFLWNGECETCQCPFDYVPTCKPKQEPAPEPSAAPTFSSTAFPTTFVPMEETAMGCYVSQSVRDGCYQLAPQPAETQHTCDCSPDICDGGTDACSAKGVGNLWSDECTSCQCPLLPTIPTQCKARSGSD